MVSVEDIDAADRLREEKGLRLDRALIQNGAITERAFLEVMGERLDFDVIDLPGVAIEPEAIQSLPSRFVNRNHLAPIARENGILKVATSDPFDLYMFDEIKLLTGLEVRPVLAPRDEIDKVIKEHYGVGGDTVEEMTGGEDLSLTSSEDDSQDLLQMAQEASVIKLVNEIILEAINERASDIHIEPFERTLSIRYRIDGVLHEAAMPPQINRFKAAIISRVKILSNMNIAERRLPQDGRIKFSVGSRQVDVRVSVIPMIFGEGVVMRILDKTNVLHSLTELGLDEETFETFQTLITKPHGIILVTGPTGSGKTTTLASMINHMNDTMDHHVITLEDPIEYYHEHKGCTINQRAIGVDVPSFAEALRRSLRMDPDVILVGEMRDLETIESAITAAETGHVVFGTLHTTGAQGTVNRIIDAFPANQQEQIRAQLSVSLIAVVSQVLLPRKDGPGRVAAFEVMLMTPAVGNLVRKNETNKIQSTIQTSRRMGMVTLDDYLLDLVREDAISAKVALEAAQDRADLETRL